MSTQQQQNLKLKEKELLESEEEIDLNYIITEKPKVTIVRDFMKHNLAVIRDPIDIKFENII